MKGRERCGLTAHGLLTRLLGAAACFTVAAGSGFAGEGPPAASPSAPQPPADKPAVSKGSSGMTIYIDPQTGAILPGPAPGAQALPLSPAEQSAVSTSHDGLVEVPGTQPGGGMKLDLQGRFQSPLMATIDADGKVRIQHMGAPAKSGDKK